MAYNVVDGEGGGGREEGEGGHKLSSDSWTSRTPGGHWPPSHRGGGDVHCTVHTYMRTREVTGRKRKGEAGGVRMKLNNRNFNI